MPAAKESNVFWMHEKVERPEMLLGSTYKIKTPVSDHAMYVTINDIVLNEGTPHEQRRPFEIFINSKNLDHYQWIVALTRIMSAVFRKGGDVTFLVDELKAVFDPRGGYWQPGGKFMPSIIAELGHIVERHLTEIGLLKPRELSDEQRKMIVSVRLTNKGGRLAQLDFPTTQRVDLYLKDKAGKVLEHWADDQKFENDSGLVAVNPGERIEYNLTVSTREMSAGGEYTVEAFFPRYEPLRATTKVVPVP